MGNRKSNRQVKQYIEFVPDGSSQWHQSTYGAWCRKNGTHQTAAQPYRCWNEEILGPGSDQLSIRWDTMLDWLDEKRDELDDELSGIFQHICNSIEGMQSFCTVQPSSRKGDKPKIWVADLRSLEHHDIAPDSLGNLLVNMKTRQRCIADAIHSSLDELLYATEYFQPRLSVRCRGWLTCSQKYQVRRNRRARQLLYCRHHASGV